jgi:hypothetical protein
MKKPKPNLHYNLDRFSGNSNESLGFALDAYLTSTRFKISDLGVSKEDLLLWKRHGILQQYFEIDDTTRFNFIDYVKIQLIDQMRSLGLSLDIISAVYAKVSSVINFKQELIELQKNPPADIDRETFHKEILSIDPDSLDDTASISILQYTVIYILVQKEHVSLIVFCNGDCEFPWYDGHVHTYSHPEIERVLYEPHVKISLTAIIRNFLSDENEKFEFPLQYQLNTPLQLLFEKIQSGKYDEILITFKNRSIELLKLTQQISPKKKNTEVLKESDFMDISASTQQTQISNITSNVKIRI